MNVPGSKDVHTTPGRRCEEPRRRSATLLLSQDLVDALFVSLTEVLRDRLPNDLRFFPTSSVSNIFDFPLPLDGAACPQQVRK